MTGQGSAPESKPAQASRKTPRPKGRKKAKTYTKKCSVCKEPFSSIRADADVCSAKCRTKKSRRLKQATA